MAAAGADVVRVSVVWRTPRWAATKAVVADAHVRGLQVLITLTTPAPDAASPRHPGARLGTWRPDARAFGAFAAEARARLGEDVDLWSLINEPNSPNHLLPQWHRGRPASPGLYRALARAGLRALRGERVLLGEELAVAHAGRRTRSPVAPLRFARAVLRRGRLDAYGWSVHPYYPTKGPLVRPPDRASLYPRSLARLLPILDRAFRAGHTTRRLDVWDTEDGVQTDPPDRVYGTSPAGQARAINEAEWIEWRTPRVRSAAQYLWRDDLSPSGFQSGLFFADGRAKPSLAAYRFPLVVTPRGHVWARLPPGVATATLRGPDGLRRTLAAGADGTVTLRVPARRGTYRAVAPGAASRKVQSRLPST